MNRSCPVNQRKPSSARLATALLPNLPGLKLEQVKVEHGEHREDGEHEAICFTLRTTTPTAQCPICHQPANHVHSRYTRTLSDLPWGSFVVRVLLHVRRFFCAVQDCARRIFTERLPTLVVPYARRTTRLVDILRLLGLAVGGRAGSRLVKRLQMGTSFSTMLRLIRQMPEQYHPVVSEVATHNLSRGIQSVSARRQPRLWPALYAASSKYCRAPNLWRNIRRCSGKGITCFGLVRYRK
jgi:hypothetical protein